MSEDQKGKMTVEEAGQMGGEARKEQIDNDPKQSYQKLGRKGGEATSAAHGREFYQEIGKKGGEARAND
jgi:general stress protein YciG